MTTNEEIFCEECGHPQTRHIFKLGFCTVNTPVRPGVGYKSCRCPRFKAKGETDAREESEAEGLGFREQGPGLGEETSLRQQG